MRPRTYSEYVDGFAVGRGAGGKFIVSSDVTGQVTSTRKESAAWLLCDRLRAAHRQGAYICRDELAAATRKHGLILELNRIRMDAKTPGDPDAVPGWTIKKLAQEAGVSYQYLCNVFQGTQVPTLEVLEKITAGLGCDLAIIRGRV